MADRRSVPPRPGRILAPWGGAAAVVLVAGGVAIGAVNATVYSPEAPVERYLEALEAGDGGTALALAGAGTALPEGTATTLLDGAPLAAGRAALGEVTVRQGERSGDRVPVEVSYAVDGREHSTVFTVERTGRDWLFFDRWRMTGVGLQAVRVEPAPWPGEAAGHGLAATVNGAEVPLAGEGVPARELAVLPPAVVDTAAAGTYLRAAPVRTVLDGAGPGAAAGEPVPVELAVEYTEEATAEANRQLDAYLAGCTEQEVLNPTGCPMGYQTSNRVPPESIDWSVAWDPAVRLLPLAQAAGGSAGGGAGEDRDLTVAAPVETRARLELQEIDLVSGEQRPVEHVEDLRLEGDLQVTPESLRYTPAWR
ncbi:hypothetical protein [Citricoccus sp. SGAir0253]|uniref:hypothetical protein n=1 Tax=Citricoccus sp. SGAir0253 TaxID=2567881 RepID=UPI00143D83C6|nr:hypothetical protein [Citricoccus sp. SGAir0253]